MQQEISFFYYSFNVYCRQCHVRLVCSVRCVLVCLAQKTGSCGVYCIRWSARKEIHNTMPVECMVAACTISKRIHTYNDTKLPAFDSAPSAAVYVCAKIRYNINATDITNLLSPRLCSTRLIHWMQRLRNKTVARRARAHLYG